MSYTARQSDESMNGVPQDCEGLCRFIEAHYPVIYCVALSHLRDIDVAQEVTQDVCVRLLLEQKKLSQIPNASAWLVLVARNTAVDWGRRRQRHSRILAMMESWKHDTTAAGTEAADARNAAINEEEKQRLYQALEHIPPEDREMLLLHFMEGVEKQELARLLEMHPATVGRRINKALRDLKAILRDFDAKKLSGLRPAEHSSRGVLATLSAVAALGTADKAALAAVAAPLPILSAGAGVGAAAAATSINSVRASLAEVMSGWFVPVVTAVAVLAGVLSYSGYVPYSTKKSSPAGSTKIAALESVASDKSHLPALRTISAGKVRNKQNASPMMKGLTSVGAYSPGYLAPGVTDGKILKGTVTDEQRKPIAGAAVTVWIPVPVRDDEDRETSRTVTSDAEGKFKFQDLPADTTAGTLTYAEVTATADGYAHATRGEYDVVLPLPTVNLDMQIVLSRPVTVQGLIANEQGVPVPGAKVKVLTEFDRNKQHYQEDGFNDDIFVTYSDTAGIFSFDELKPGYVALAVEHPEYAPQLSEAIPSDSKSVRLSLDKGVSIVGTFHDGATTVTGVRMVVVRGTFKGTGSGYESYLATDKNGVFEATRLPVYGIDYENARLPVRRKDQRSWDYNISLPTAPVYDVKLHAGESTRTLAINRQDPRAIQVGRWRRVVLTGQIPDTLPLQNAGGATLHGTITTPDSFSSGTRVSVLMRQGIDFWESVSVQNSEFQLQGIPPGTYKISGKTADVAPGAPCQLLGPQDVTLRDGELHTVELRPGESGVRGRVTGLETVSTPTVQLVTLDPLSPWHEGGKGIISEQTINADGSFEFQGLVPGDYYIVVMAGTQAHSEAFTCRKGEIVQCDVTLPSLLTVTGSVIDSATSTPVSGANLMFIPKGQAIGKHEPRDFGKAKTNTDGTYTAGITTGSYTLSVSSPGQEVNSTLQVDVREGQTEVPPVDISIQLGGIMMSRLASAADDVMWRQAKFNLVDLETGQFAAVSYSTYFLDDDTAVMQNIPVGDYGLVVRCAAFGGEVSQLFATAYFPNLEVKRDSFAMVVMPLQKGIPVTMSYQPGKEGARWKQLDFWLKDPSGVKIPVHVSFTLGQELLMGLAPGSYELGVTLDSSEEQSVSFEVAPGEKDKEVVLRLR